MASLNESLLPPSKPGRIRHASTGSLSSASTPSKDLQKRWTFASLSEKEFQDVDRGKVLGEGMAKVFTAKDISQTSKVLGKGFRRLTMTLDQVLPPAKGADGEADGEADEDSAEGDAAPACSNGEATLNLLNNCLGSGMLGMGFCIAQTGLLGGFLIMAFSALLNRHTLMMNINATAFAGCKPASTELGFIAYGTPGRLLLVGMVVLLGFFCMVSYIDASADALAGLLGTVLGDSLPSETTIAIVSWAVLLVPPTLIRSMSLVAMLSFVAFCGGICIVVSLTVVCAQSLLANGLPPLDRVRLFPADASGFLNAFPILMLVFSVQAGGDVVLVTMKDTSVPNMYRVLNFSYSVVFVMLYFIGSLCYLTWLDDTRGDILKNFTSSSVMGLVARVASLDLVVLSYMIMIIPCKVALIDLIFGKNEALQESTKAQFFGTTMVVNVLALATALAVSDLSLVLGLDGAVCTNFVAFMLPTIFWIKVRSKPASASLDAVAMLSPKNATDAVIFLLGAISLVFSSYQLMQRFVAS